MEQTGIAAKVTRIIAEQLGAEVAEVTGEKTFETLNGDSLDHIELVIELENEFGIEIPDEDWDKVKTVQDAIDCITKVKS